MTTRSITFISVAGLFLLSLMSCSFNMTSSPCTNASPKTEVRPLDSFTGIDLAGSANIELTQGSPQKVEIEGPTCDVENTTTTVSDSVLSIGNDHNVRGFRGKVTIRITVPNFNRLTISGSGSLNTTSSLQTNDLRLTISGSGSINISDLKANRIHTSIAGSGSVDLGGTEKVESQSIQIAGSGDVRAKTLPTSYVSVKIAGSGSCYLNVTDTLKASVMGSGDIYYKGKPSIESSLGGSGKVKSLE